MRNGPRPNWVAAGLRIVGLLLEPETSWLVAPSTRSPSTPAAAGCAVHFARAAATAAATPANTPRRATLPLLCCFVSCPSTTHPSFVFRPGPGRTSGSGCRTGDLLSTRELPPGRGPRLLV